MTSHRIIEIPGLRPHVRENQRTMVFLSRASPRHLHPQALAAGHLDWTDVAVAVHTNLLEGAGLFSVGGSSSASGGTASSGISREEALEAQLKVFDKLHDASSQVGAEV